MIPEESGRTLARQAITSLENTEGDLNKIWTNLATLFDLQRGKLHEASTDTQQHIYHQNPYDHALGHLGALHLKTIRAIKLQPGPIDEASSTRFPLPDEAEEIKALGGPEGFLKIRFLEYAAVAYLANHAYFCQRLTEKYLQPITMIKSPLR